MHLAPTQPDFPFSAAILAGGRSSRMGRDKAFLPTSPDGLSLIVRQAALLRNLGTDDLLISGQAGIDYGVTDARVVNDTVADCGPLSGISAILSSARHPWVVVIAVDLPHISAIYLKKILTASAGRTGLVPLGPSGFEPLVAVYPKSFLSLVHAALVGGRLSLQPIIQAAVTNDLILSLPILESELTLFTNWNTPEDLHR